MQEGLRAQAGPDHWNDPDMLEGGNGMTAAEDRAHFSLWAMLAAPLIAGNPLARMRPATREILTDSEVIAVDQDRLGGQGFRASKLDNVDAWAEARSAGTVAVTFLNRGTATVSLRYDWRKHRIEDQVSKTDFDFAKKTYQIRNIWSHQDLGSTKPAFVLRIPVHDVGMVKLNP